jgi:hypothetical protein
VASPPSSDLGARARALVSERGVARRVQLLLGLGLVLTGCVTVKPQDKELLADPAMIYGSEGASGQQEQHVLENRQGASEGSARGGGCGCN